jgi:uroporphyrinogen-III synthase
VLPEIKQSGGFSGLRVVAFESRHQEAMERLIEKHGGEPLVATSVREVPLEENEPVFDFARELFDGRIDMVIFLTGVGTRALTKLIETWYPREQWVSALSRVIVAARGPKPVAALRELGVPIRVAAPEPNTWRELLAELDKQRDVVPLSGCRVAVQEYGVVNPDLLTGLKTRGAVVRRVPVYQWALPLDTAPLRQAIAAMAAGKVDIALFTTSVQVVHVMGLATYMGREAALREAFQRMMIASIGPTTSETLKEYEIPPDMEPTHPKMAILVAEAAARSRELLTGKRNLLTRQAGMDCA